MPLPGITHLQFLLLSILGTSEMSGRELRAELRKEGVAKSAPAFYQLMARIEDRKLAAGWYESREVDGHTVRERMYKLLGAGSAAVDEAHRFYAATPELARAPILSV